MKTWQKLLASDIYRGDIIENKLGSRVVMDEVSAVERVTLTGKLKLIMKASPVFETTPDAIVEVFR